MIDNSKNKGLRNQLVKSLKDKGINDFDVLNAIKNVPRQWFMESGLDGFAYEDRAFPIGEQQTISQPYTVAYQTELLKINKGDKVLEIGTGSGYQTCVLIEIGCRVYSIERQRVLFKKSNLLFSKIKWKPKKLILGDGYIGLKENAPYNAIIVTAGAPYVPKELLNQLSIGGRLVIPVGNLDHIMTRYTRISKNKFNKEAFGKFKFVPLLKNKN